MSVGGGQRMLAAIVFTDVVGYSVLAGSDEARAIRLLQRDSEIISKLCVAHDGQVLKNTGDGLLMCFSSAVEAVNCAIEVQQQLHENAKLLGKDDILYHRIGVHLGDVVVLPDDVIGDGVNIANRIQDEARPGGIALSQTVYEVVKNKVKVNATSLGIRNLKHIVEPMTVWAIPPVGQPAGGSQYTTNTPMQDQMMATPISSFEEPKSDGTKGILLAIAAVILLLVPIGIFAYMRSQPPAKPPIVVEKTEEPKTEKTEEPKTATPPAPPEKEKEQEKAPPQPEEDKNGETVVDTPTDAEEAPLKDLVSRDTPLRETLATFKKKYDFEGAGRWLEDQGYTSTPAGKALRERYQELADFRTWLESQLTFSNATDPLVLLRPGTPGQTKVWGNDDGSVTVQTRGDPRTIPFEEIKAESFLLTAKAALQKEQPGEKKPRLVIRRWMGVFAREYDLPPPRLPR